MHTIVIIAYEGAQVLDVTGPAAVFAEAAEFQDAPPYRIVIASIPGGPITTSSGIALSTVPLENVKADGIDTVLVPGASPRALRAALDDGLLRERGLAAASIARRVGSICTGAFILASWGLLDGRHAATHWSATAELARLFPAVHVDPHAIYVEDSGIWTSAGVSTGIDMALALVEQDLGQKMASDIARRLVLQMRRPGHQSQFSAMLDAQDGPYAALAEWASDHLSEDLSLEALAQHAGQAPRTFHRRFTAAIGMSPAAFIERLRLDRARALLDLGRTPKQVALEAGFGSLDRLGRAFRREYDLTPSLYRALHQSGSNQPSGQSKRPSRA